MVQADERSQLLREVELFRDIDASELQLIVQQMKEESYADRQVVFREGDPGDRLFILLEGTMHIYVNRENQVITYNRLQAGECFGDEPASS